MKEEPTKWYVSINLQFDPSFDTKKEAKEMEKTLQQVIKALGINGKVYSYKEGKA